MVFFSLYEGVLEKYKIKLSTVFGTYLYLKKSMHVIIILTRKEIKTDEKNIFKHFIRTWPNHISGL